MFPDDHPEAGEMNSLVPYQIKGQVENQKYRNQKQQGIQIHFPCTQNKFLFMIIFLIQWLVTSGVASYRIKMNPVECFTK